MEPLSVLSIVILTIVGLFLLRMLLHSIRIVFVTLLLLLAAVYFFGISWSDIISALSGFLLWVL